MKKCFLPACLAALTLTLSAARASAGPVFPVYTQLAGAVENVQPKGATLDDQVDHALKEQRERDAASQKEIEKKHDQNLATRVRATIRFIEYRDVKLNQAICFTYYAEGTSPPSVSYIPCDQVPTGQQIVLEDLYPHN